MDCSTLPANGLEDNITEDMLEFYMEHALVSATPSNVPDAGSINLGGYVWGKQRDNGQSASFSARQGSPLMFGLSPARAPRLSRTELSSGSLMGLESMEDIVMQRQSRRTSVQQRPLLESESHEDVASDITSDDSGDFAFFTQDVRDANAYDTIRDYVVYCKQQERDLEELEEECARLEAEQQQLYGAAMAAKMTRRSSVSAGGASSTVPGLSSTNGKGRGLGGTLRGGTTNNGSGTDLSFLSDVADEFGEGGIDPLRACPLTELPVTSSSCSSGSAKGRSAFRYAAPDVVGDYNPVFKSGFLYRCATPEGLWVFYNDSHKYQMEVRYLFGATSVIAAGPHAVLKRLPSGEMEVAVTVWPQETEVLLQGEVNGFKNLSVATPVDASYVNPHTAATTAEATALLGRVARQCGKSSTAMLTTADVLDCCLKGKDAAKAQTAGMHFVDPAFPPSRASLCRRDVDDAFLWDMPWRRPTAYLPQRQAHEASLFAGAAALPTDPSTGDGGDAYLCSAAALLAEAPERVYRLFRHPNRSPDAARAEAAVGAHHVTLGHGGWWTTTVVDDYLPASLRGPDLGRCTHDLRKLWYPLLEKAYAKLHGSYAAIQYGDPLEALQDFTGFPTFRFDEEWAEVAEDVRASFSGHGVSAESEALFAMLESKVRDCGYLVCLSLPDEGPAEAKSVHMGMLYGMSYAVLRVVRYGDYRLLQVRCPTLRLDGDGLWCAESVRWRQEPELARLCGMASGAEDGSSEDAAATPGGLWLDWSEALLMFEGGGVCCVHSSWTEDCRVRGAFHDGVPSCVLEVYVHEEEGSATTTDGGATAAAAAAPVEVYCVLSQEDDRGLPPDHPNRALLPLMLCVSSALEPSDVTDTEATLSCSVSSRQCIRLACSTDPDNPTDQLSYILGRDTALRTKLQPSTQPYYIVPRCLGEMSSKLFTVGIISATPVTKDGRLRVRAVQLPSASPVFKNQRVFSAERVTPVAAASFQLRGADGRVRVGCGSGIG